MPVVCQEVWHGYTKANTVGSVGPSLSTMYLLHVDKAFVFYGVSTARQAPLVERTRRRVAHFVTVKGEAST